MNVKFLLLASFFVISSSCQISIPEDDTGSQTQTYTDTDNDVNLELDPSSSTILGDRVTASNYTAEISNQNYQSLFFEYNEMFVDMREIYDHVTSGEPVIAQSDGVSSDNIQRDIEFVTFDCQVSGTLEIEREYEVVNSVSTLIYEYIETNQCIYDDDTEHKNFEYELFFEDGVTFENFNYKNQNDEIISVDSAFSEQGDDSLLELYINHEYFGRFFIRAENEFRMNETISIYGRNDSSAVLLNSTMEKDDTEPCYYYNLQHYSLNGADTIEVLGESTDLCVSNFVEGDNSYLLTDTFDSELSVISYTLALRDNNSLIDAVFTLDNNDSLLELTITQYNAISGNDDVLFYDVDNIITLPFDVLDAGNYEFYFRNINYTGVDDSLFVQLETQESFFDHIIGNSNNGPDFESEQTFVWSDNSGIEKDAQGNIRQQIVVLDTSTYYFRISSEVDVYTYLSDSNENILLDYTDIYQLSDTQYYFYIQLQPGTYYLDLGASNASRQSRVTVQVDERPI